MDTHNNIFFVNEYAKIQYNRVLDALFLEFNDNVTDSNEVVKINAKALEAFKKLNTNKFVVDIRSTLTINPESEKWIVNTLFPKMIKHLNGQKLYHFQYINEKNSIQKVTGKGVLQRVLLKSNEIACEQFTDWELLIERLKEIR